MVPLGVMIAGRSVLVCRRTPLIAERSDIDDMCERIEKSLADALKMVGA